MSAIFSKRKKARIASCLEFLGQKLLLNSVNADSFTVLIHSLELNSTVDFSVKGIVRALTYILAGMDVCTALSYKDVACKNELTVCALNAETL